MLVEKLICNARLNLLILHPFPTPSQLPQQTEAQWPIYTEVPRNKNIYLRKEGEGRRERERGDREGNEERVSAHMSQLWTAQWWLWWRGYKCSPWLSPSQTKPHLLCKPLSTCIIQPFISQQTKHVTPPFLNPTSSAQTPTCTGKPFRES